MPTKKTRLKVKSSLTPKIRDRIMLDPDSNCQAGSGSVFGIRILKVKLSYKNPLFPQIFHDFHVFLKLYQIKVLCFIKYLRYLIGWKQKLNIYFLGWKLKFLPNFSFCLWKICFLLPGSKSGIWIRIEEKNPGSGSVKNESGSETLVKSAIKFTFWAVLCVKSNVTFIELRRRRQIQGLWWICPLKNGETQMLWKP